MRKRIHLYCDGACSGNPGVGGWSCVRYEAETNTIYDAYTGNDSETTNNRMELKGLLQALQLANEKYADCDVTIYCDSAYTVNIFNEWIYTWARNN